MVRLHPLGLAVAGLAMEIGPTVFDADHAVAAMNAVGVWSIREGSGDRIFAEANNLGVVVNAQIRVLLKALQDFARGDSQANTVQHAHRSLMETRHFVGRKHMP